MDKDGANLMSGKSAFIAIIATTMLFSATPAAFAAPLAGMARTTVQTGPARHMATRRATVAPFSFARFCADYSGQCEARGASGPVKLTPQRRDELRRINTAVNRAIRYEEDEPGDDVWKIGVTAGDCEDYVLAKRQKLLAAGWPSSALRIAIATTPSGIGHAVLVITTEDQDLVLDNRTNTIKPWHTVNLNWLKIQNPDNPKKWLAL